MKYVLSTGKVTSSQVEYIKDCIRLELSLLKRDIPYFYGGIDIVDGSIVTSDVQASINSIVSDMLNRISKTVEGVKLSISSIAYSDSSINISVNVNGTDSYYELKRTN